MAEKTLFGGDVFRHHQPITGDHMAARVLSGLDGAFVERIGQEGYNVAEPSIGACVQCTPQGVIEGVRVLKCGKVKPKEMHAHDVWPASEEAWIVVPEFDLSVFGDFNGTLTTPYRDLPFKVMVRTGTGDNRKPVKKSQWEAKGFSNLAFRVNFTPLSASKAKFLLSAIPGSVDTLETLYGEEVHSRGFPGIRIHEGRAKLVTPEEQEHRYGLGIQPFFVFRGARVDEGGEVDTSELEFPASMDTKAAVVGMFQSAVIPNWSWKHAQWDEAVRAKKFGKRLPAEMWPSPIQEDANMTENSESEDEG